MECDMRFVYYSPLLSSLYFPHRFVSDLCANRLCGKNQMCIIYGDRRTDCICKTCHNAYKMVCGDDLKTYASPCRLDRNICL